MLFPVLYIFFYTTLTLKREVLLIQTAISDMVTPKKVKLKSLSAESIPYLLVDNLIR